MEEVNKTKIIKSIIWKFAERIGAQGIGFIISIILARLLTPDTYGVVALTAVFLNITNVFLEGGFGTALIQKKDADDIDFSTVFYFSVLSSIILYIILFFTSIPIADFYNKPELVLILRVLAVVVIINGFRNTYNSYVFRKMIFKKIFICNLIGLLISGTIGILMAYWGFGVWALVTQQLINALVATVILWIIVKWKPSLVFSWDRLKGLFRFGWKMLCSGLIGTIYDEIYGLAIGKIYTTEQFAYFNKSNQIPKVITENIDGTVATVMLPALSHVQDDKERFKNLYKKAIKNSTYIVFPIVLGLMTVARSLILVLLTEKWIAAVPIMQLLCLSYAALPVNSLVLHAISATGRSDITLKVQILIKVIGIVCLVIGIPFGLTVMLIMKIVSSLLTTLTYVIINKRLWDYKIYEQAKDVLTNLAIASFMALIVFTINFTSLAPLPMLIVQVMVGMIVYLSCSYALKIDAFIYFSTLIKDKMKLLWGKND